MPPLLAIAHFCDTHGPTPLMVTQAQTVPCYICIDCYHNESEDQYYPQSRKGSQTSIQNTVAQITSTLLNTTLDGPQEKQKSEAQDLHASSRRRDSSFRKTYNDDDKKQASPCGNCALTVPSHLKGKIPAGAPGGPSQNDSSPYLRTRRPIQRISAPSEDTTPSASSSSSPPTSVIGDPDGSDALPTLARGSTSTVQQITFNTRADKDAAASVHEHFLDYTSTHTPISSPTYTLLRNCCLRTLSTETLPPSTLSPPNSPLITTHASFHSTSSGGPIFFGDPLAGYTTAYIFRIPDPCARGRIRRYALMALDTSGQRRAMRAFSFLATKFRELASWILELAEREAERLESVGSTEISATTRDATETVYEGKRASLVSYPVPMAPPLPSPSEVGSVGQGQMRYKQTSSFLSGRTFEPDGYLRKGGYGNGFRARGLAELVGTDDFFLELHRRFVLLLAQVS